MPGGELEPIGRSGPALAEVATEMSEIFARAGMGQPAVGPRRPVAVAALRPSRGGSPATTLMIAAAAGLVGLGAGAFVIRTPAAPVQPDAKIGQAQRAQARLPPQPQAPVTPPIALAEAAPAPAEAAAPVARPPVVNSPPASVKAARASARSRIKLAQARPAMAKPPIRLREPPPMAQPASCEQDVSGDDCRRAVILADRHLRAVYEGAIRRGVPRGVLTDYRDRWADLRERDTDDPTRLIETYGALAYDLGRENADDQDDSPRPKGRSGLKALADLLLPWR